MELANSVVLPEAYIRSHGLTNCANKRKVCHPPSDPVPKHHLSRRTDITQHRTREGWLYCCAVLDAFSRRIVGWSIDSRPDSTLVVNALDMAIRNRQPAPGGVVHADHGPQFTSWVFGEMIRKAGLLPSFGSVGDGLDNAMIESFCSSMQIELLNRKKWSTRVELANAIFDYIEIFHNRKRRHSALGSRIQF